MFVLCIAPVLRPHVAVQNFGNNQTPQDELDAAIAAEDALRNRIIFAREDLPDVQLKSEQMMYLCEEASRAGCQGQRAEIFAVEVRTPRRRAAAT